MEDSYQGYDDLFDDKIFATAHNGGKVVHKEAPGRALAFRKFSDYEGQGWGANKPIEEDAQTYHSDRVAHFTAAPSALTQYRQPNWFQNVPYAQTPTSSRIAPAQINQTMQAVQAAQVLQEAQQNAEISQQMLAAQRAMLFPQSQGAAQQVPSVTSMRRFTEESDAKNLAEWALDRNDYWGNTDPAEWR